MSEIDQQTFKEAIEEVIEAFQEKNPVVVNPTEQKIKVSFTYQADTGGSR
jgi:hypothetical protein